MKKLKTLKDKKKKIRIFIIAGVAVLLIAGGIFAFFFIKNETLTSKNTMNLPSGMQGITISDDWVTASGVTNAEVTEVTFEVENLSTELEIEEVYINSNDEINEGDKVLKVTDESLEAVRAELTDALEEAELAYRTGVISYEQTLITAEYTKDSAVLSGSQAKEIYDETIESLSDAVDKAKEELEEANEKIAEYESYVNDSSYASYFKVDEYQAIYDENLSVLKEKLDEWGVSWSEVTGGGMGGGSTNLNGNLSYAQILRALYSVLEQNLEDLENAKAEYEDAVENASFELQTLKLNLSSLEKAVYEAEENYEIQAENALLTYETALSNADRAESDYETTVDKAESDLDELETAYEDAKENLELFEECIGDGYFYASESGDVLRTQVRTGGSLTSDSVIFMYSNPNKLTISVSVDQADIAKLTVGDECYAISDSVGAKGVITEIDPVSSSDSVTSVYYSVTVTVTSEEDSTSTLSQNDSVTVLFNLTDEEIESIEKAMSGNGKSGDMSGNDTPPNMDSVSGNEMPNGDFDPSSFDGEAPSGDFDPGSFDGEAPSGGDFTGTPQDSDGSTTPPGSTDGD